MATTYKILGQVNPSDTAVTNLYTAPSSTSAVVSTITATNVTGAPTEISVFVVQDSGTAGTGNALVYEAELTEKSVQAFTLGLTLSAGDSLQVQVGNSAAVTFQAFGSELS